MELLLLLCRIFPQGIGNEDGCAIFLQEPFIIDINRKTFVY
jgi:hypothetical protein